MQSAFKIANIATTNCQELGRNRAILSPGWAPSSFIREAREEDSASISEFVKIRSSTTHGSSPAPVFSRSDTSTLLAPSARKNQRFPPNSYAINCACLKCVSHVKTQKNLYQVHI